MDAMNSAPVPREITVTAEGRSFSGSDMDRHARRGRIPLARRHHAVGALVAGAADRLAGARPPQKKLVYGTGRRSGGGGCLVQCDSIHRTRGSGPGGDTGSTNART